MTEPASRRTSGRSLLGLAAALITPAVFAPASWVTLAFVVAGVATAVLGLQAGRGELSSAGARWDRGVLVALGAVQCLACIYLTVANVEAPQPVPWLLAGLLVVLVAGATATVLRGQRRAGLALAGAAVATMVVVAVLTPVVIDVLVFEHDGTRALLHGTNPFAITYRDPFPPEADDVFYGPGIAHGGRLHVGFPYPPVTLLLLLPGLLLGDVRIALGLAVVATVLALAWRAGPAGTRWATAVALVPGLVYLLSYGWTEPLVLLALALTVVAAGRRSRATPYLLGWLLVSKQYMVLALPLCLLLLPVAKVLPGGVRGFVVRTAATGLLLTVPFLLWSPSGFWDSVVMWQFRQPFRPDSLSALVLLVNATGWPPPAVYGLLPLAAAGLTAVLLAWRVPRTPAMFAAGLALTLAVLVLTSKQAFANYYFLVVGSLLTAAATWGRAGALPVVETDGETLPTESHGCGSSPMMDQTARRSPFQESPPWTPPTR